MKDWDHHNEVVTFGRVDSEMYVQECEWLCTYTFSKYCVDYLNGIFIILILTLLYIVDNGSVYFITNNYSVENVCEKTDKCVSFATKLRVLVEFYKIIMSSVFVKLNQYSHSQLLFAKLKLLSIFYMSLYISILTLARFQCHLFALCPHDQVAEGKIEFACDF